MGEVEELEGVLDAEWVELLQGYVTRGEYESIEDIVDEALAEWRMQHLTPEELKELRRLVQEGIDSGPAVDGETAFAEILADLRRKKSASAAE